MKNLFSKLNTELTTEEFSKANSKNFPISTLERIISKESAQKKLKYHFEGPNLIIKSTEKSFLKALAALVKRIVAPKSDKIHINSRSLNRNEDIEKVVNELPDVEKGCFKQETIDTKEVRSQKENKKEEKEDTSIEKQKKKDRNRLIPGNLYVINSNHRLINLFNELKNIPIQSYPNATSASIRVLLDLAVRHFIESKGYVESICLQNKRNSLKEIVLKKRLEFIKNKLQNRKAQKTTNTLLNPENPFSLDTLNCYIHSSDKYTLNKDFLHDFWESLYPLLQEILSLKQEEKD